MATLDVLSIYNPCNQLFSVYADEDLRGWGLNDVLYALHGMGEDETRNSPEDEVVEQNAHAKAQETGADGAKEPNKNKAIGLAVDRQATVLIIVRHRTDVVREFLGSIDPDLTNLFNNTAHLPTPPFQDKPCGVIASTVWYPAPILFEPKSYRPYQFQARLVDLWLLPASTGRTSTHRPIVVICPVPGDEPEVVRQTTPEKMTKGNTDAEALVRYFEDNSCERANRIAKNMYYVFVDLHYFLGHKNWRANINALKRGYTFTAEQAGERALIALSRVKLMHRRVGEIYRLLDLRMIYVATLDSYISHIPQLTKAGDDGYVHGILSASSPELNVDTTGQDLKRRINIINNELGHYERDIGILLEKFRNLIDLEFSIQSTVTNQNIEAITYLAFLFAPMSFVAGVFGVNGITAPKYFWVAIIPVALTAVLFAFSMRPTVRFFARKESHRHGLALEATRRSRRRNDAEA